MNESDTPETDAEFECIHVLHDMAHLHAFHKARDFASNLERRNKRFVEALRRIERGESEVFGLSHEFYGHAKAIAKKALADQKEEKI